MIPYGRQTIDQSDIDAVVAILKSDFLTQGPAVPAFEKAVCDYVGAKHGVAVNSATSALHIACLALGVGPGDMVWTSPNTFVASANCARYCGADVDFVDIDPRTYNLCAEKLANKLTLAEKHGKLPKVVIPVHFAGQPCDMVAIHNLSKRFGFSIIEDASHAIGATHQNTKTGDCTHSDITVFSFHPVKIITTAEGGLATTNSPDLARKMQLLRSHGITRDHSELNDTHQGAWYYEQHTLGFNYRMTDIQAALGLSQLKNIKHWITARHEIAKKYDEQLSDVPVVLPTKNSNCYSALHLYPIRVRNRRHVFDALREAGVGVNVHYIPVHMHPDFRTRTQVTQQFPDAEAYYSEAISLPMFASLSDDSIEYVVLTLKSILRR